MPDLIEAVNVKKRKRKSVEATDSEEVEVVETGAS
jgi:hypothetical protein